MTLDVRGQGDLSSAQRYWQHRGTMSSSYLTKTGHSDLLVYVQCNITVHDVCCSVHGVRCAEHMYTYLYGRYHEAVASKMVHQCSHYKTLVVTSLTHGGVELGATTGQWCGCNC